MVLKLSPLFGCSLHSFACTCGLYICRENKPRWKTCQGKKLLAKKNIENRCFNIPRTSWTCIRRCSWMLKLSSPVSTWLFCIALIHCPTSSVSKCSSSPASSRKALSKSLPKIPIPHDDGLDNSQLLPHIYPIIPKWYTLLSLLMEICSRLFPSYLQVVSPILQRNASDLGKEGTLREFPPPDPYLIFHIFNYWRLKLFIHFFTCQPSRPITVNAWSKCSCTGNIIQRSLACGWDHLLFRQDFFGGGGLPPKGFVLVQCSASPAFL